MSLLFIYRLLSYMYISITFYTIVTCMFLTSFHKAKSYAGANTFQILFQTIRIQNSVKRTILTKLNILLIQNDTF